jgi:hypothetical protein
VEIEREIGRGRDREKEGEREKVPISRGTIKHCQKMLFCIHKRKCDILENGFVRQFIFSVSKTLLME